MVIEHLGYLSAEVSEEVEKDHDEKDGESLEDDLGVGVIENDRKDSVGDKQDSKGNAHLPIAGLNKIRCNLLSSCLNVDDRY